MQKHHKAAKRPSLTSLQQRDHAHLIRGQWKAVFLFLCLPGQLGLAGGSLLNPGEGGEAMWGGHGARPCRLAPTLHCLQGEPGGPMGLCRNREMHGTGFSRSSKSGDRGLWAGCEYSQPHRGLGRGSCQRNHKGLSCSCTFPPTGCPPSPRPSLLPMLGTRRLQGIALVPRGCRGWRGKTRHHSGLLASPVLLPYPVAVLLLTEGPEPHWH